MNLPESNCPLGYTRQQIEKILINTEDFFIWLDKQEGIGVTFCDGLVLKDNLIGYNKTECWNSKHGVVFPKELIEEFVSG